jgi:carbon-monoxide dehydrogenase large subunit
VPILGAFMYNAIYKFPAYQFNCTNYYTNKTLVDAYRGAGRPEATFAIERLMDELAVELDVDPLEIREKNWIKHEEFPFTSVAGLEYDSGNYEAATARAKEMFGYDELRLEQERRRQSMDPVQLGIGVSTFTEMCGLAPSRVLHALKYIAGGWDAATIEMLPTGTVRALIGVTPHGQGHVTTFSQIVADQLGVDVADVEVLHGDTQVVPLGMDTYGSRSLAVGGVAMHFAGEKVLAKARTLAAHQLECSEDDLEFAAGDFTVRGTDKSVNIKALAFAAWTAHDLPDGMEPGLTATHLYDPPNFSWPNGAHACVVEVDTETGSVDILRYVAVDDCGVVINPMVVEGQVHGGVAQGIGGALYEKIVYDERGQLLTGTFMDFLIPTAMEVPDVEVGHIETPSPLNPLGVKGVGEAGAIPVPALIAEAVDDALSPWGVRVREMPLSPGAILALLDHAPRAPAWLREPALGRT